MKVQELLTNINQDNFNLENALAIKKYLPIEAKKAVAQAIIYECTENINGVLKMDSVQKHLLYVKYMIVTHTNLEYTEDDYNILCSTEYHDVRLLDRIMRCFEDDAKECKRVLNWMVEDYKREIGIEGSISRFLNDLSVKIANVADKFEDINIKSMIPDDLDMKKLSTFLNNYIK